MNNLILRTLAGMSLFAVSTAGMAVTMDITASFAPSMEKPENNAFTNTTPQSGYCDTWPNYCAGQSLHSISLPLTASRIENVHITPETAPEEGVYFRMPGAWRTLTVTNNISGENTSVQIRFSGFSARIAGETDGYDWSEGHLGYAPSPCSTGATPVGSGIRWMAFLWLWPQSNAICYKTSTIDRSDSKYDGDLVSYYGMGIGYELKTPNPLTLGAGVYTGQLQYSVGYGGDIDFGKNYQPSDTEITINFTLSVNHELKLTTTADDQAVSLQPCASGRVCSADEGQANWERWMVTRITPQLTGRSNFRLSSSGAFTVYLECEQQSGSDCALRSDKMPSQTVPVRTLLTLPDNIVDNVTGSTVSKRQLAAGRDLSRNVFVAKTFGQNRVGSIDFLVSQKDVDTMLTTRPDTYRGAVTVIFDPKIY